MSSTARSSAQEEWQKEEREHGVHMMSAAKELNSEKFCTEEWQEEERDHGVAIRCTTNEFYSEKLFIQEWQKEGAIMW